LLVSASIKRRVPAKREGVVAMNAPSKRIDLMPAKRRAMILDHLRANGAASIQELTEKSVHRLRSGFRDCTSFVLGGGPAGGESRPVGCRCSYRSGPLNCPQWRFFAGKGEALKHYPDLTAEGFANEPGFNETERKKLGDRMRDAWFPACAPAKKLKGMVKPFRLPECLEI